MEDNKAVGYGLSFVLGTILGAVLGLLFAPSSGDELRRNIKEQVDIQYAKVQEGLQTGMEKIQSTVEKVSHELAQKTEEVVEVVESE
jgi:gas vesicle protein